MRGEDLSSIADGYNDILDARAKFASRSACLSLSLTPRKLYYKPID